MEIENLKQKFYTVYNKYIAPRDGADKLLKWLESTDFFSAPASTRYHGSYEGGLLEHSINVYNELIKEWCITYNYASSDEIPFEEHQKIAVVSLLHDLCKTGFYSKDYRNAKNENGVWERVSYYKIEDKLPYGHGEKSVFMIERFMRLSIEEAMCIRWHMGGFDEAVKGGCYALSGAYEQYPLAVCLHIADMRASYLIESRGN